MEEKMISDPNALEKAFHHADAARNLCGQHVRYQQQRYLIADVLWEEGLMILHAMDRNEVQNDSFGRPHRVVASEVRIHLRNSDGTPSTRWQDLELVEDA